MSFATNIAPEGKNMYNTYHHLGLSMILEGVLCTTVSSSVQAQREAL